MNRWGSVFVTSWRIFPHYNIAIRVSIPRPIWKRPVSRQACGFMLHLIYTIYYSRPRRSLHNIHISTPLPKFTFRSWLCTYLSLHSSVIRSLESFNRFAIVFFSPSMVSSGVAHSWNWPPVVGHTFILHTCRGAEGMIGKTCRRPEGADPVLTGSGFWPPAPGAVPAPKAGAVEDEAVCGADGSVGLAVPPGILCSIKVRLRKSCKAILCYSLTVEPG